MARSPTTRERRNMRVSRATQFTLEELVTDRLGNMRYKVVWGRRWFRKYRALEGLRERLSGGALTLQDLKTLRRYSRSKRGSAYALAGYAGAFVELTHLINEETA